MSSFDQAWEVVKMPIGWPCTTCGYHNLREGGTKAGMQVIMDVCDECGEMPTDMPTFVDDQEHGAPQKRLDEDAATRPSKEFQRDNT